MSDRRVLIASKVVVVRCSCVVFRRRRLEFHQPLFLVGRSVRCSDGCGYGSMLCVFVMSGVGDGNLLFELEHLLSERGERYCVFVCFVLLVGSSY